MSQVEELLNGIPEDEIATYLARPENEPHVVIDENRFITVPEELKRIAVQYDHDIETVTFDCPRYWDGHDMSKMAVYINYMRSDRGKGCYPVAKVTVDESDPNVMHFDWTISQNVTLKDGNIAFLVCIKKLNDEGYEENHWNSELNDEMYVSEGLECGETIAALYPDILQQWYDELTKEKESGRFDGISPGIQIVDIDGGHRVIITDREGTHEFNVMDGDNTQAHALQHGKNGSDPIKPQDIGATNVCIGTVDEKTLALDNALTQGEYNLTILESDKIEGHDYPDEGTIYGKLLVYINTGGTHNNSSNWIWQVYLNTSNYRIAYRNKVNSNTWSRWSHFYNESYKPTPADISAVAKTGDTMTGNLTFTGSNNVFLNRPDVTGTWNKGMLMKNIDGSVILGGVRFYGSGDDLQNIWLATVGTDVSKGLRVTPTGMTLNQNKVYHAGDKPTANELKAYDLGGNGTELENVDNLDTIVDPGNYFYNPTMSGIMTDPSFPTLANFTMKVSHPFGTSSAVKIQEVYEVYGERQYKRTRSADGVWSEWSNPIGDIASILDAINGEVV